MAYEFATNQYLEASSAPVVDVPLTMACWFNPNNITGTEVLVCLGNSTGLSRFLLVAAGAVSGDPARYIMRGANNAGPTVDSSAAYSANTWQHICGTSSSFTNHTVYLDGANSTNVASSSGASAISGIDRTLIAAQRTGSGLFNYANAIIAEVGIWNAALTADEIASLAKGMTCDKVRPQNLVFYAPLVRDLVDAKGGLTITNNNTATVDDHPRVYA